jgi:hypothetical protein
MIGSRALAAVPCRRSRLAATKKKSTHISVATVLAALKKEATRNIHWSTSQQLIKMDFLVLIQYSVWIDGSIAVRPEVHPRPSLILLLLG